MRSLRLNLLRAFGNRAAALALRPSLEVLGWLAAIALVRGPALG